MSTNTPDAYAAARKRVDEQIRQVQAGVHRHANKAMAEPKNRALVSEILHVAEILSEAVEFLGGPPEMPR